MKKNIIALSLLVMCLSVGSRLSAMEEPKKGEPEKTLAELFERYEKIEFERYEKIEIEQDWQREMDEDKRVDDNYEKAMKEADDLLDWAKSMRTN